MEENASCTDTESVIGHRPLTRDHRRIDRPPSRHQTSPVYTQSLIDDPLDQSDMEVFAGQFENVAKMSRLALSTGSGAADHDKSPPPVKVRPVYYSPSHASPHDSPHYRHSESDSRSDASTPRPTPVRGERPASGTDGRRMFYRTPFTGEPGMMEDHTIEDRAGLEKWRNKQRQREFKQRLTKEEIDDERTKENRRHRILTRRQRDQLHRRYSDDPYEVYSDVDARYGHRQYGSSRSGYSTPGGSCDERNLGRSMRAAPRHVRPARGGPRSTQGTKDKDLIEMLNRQQHMMMQQREQRHRFLEEQKIKQHAQQVVNRALLHDAFDERKISSKDTKEMKQLLNDAFPLAGSQHDLLISSNGIADGQQKVSGDVTPTNYGYTTQNNDNVRDDKSGSNTPTSVIEQVLVEGRVSHQSSRKNSSQEDLGDFFDTQRNEIVEDKKDDDAEKSQSNDETIRPDGDGKYMQAIRDELQRLNTS